MDLRSSDQGTLFLFPPPHGLAIHRRVTFARGDKPGLMNPTLFDRVCGLARFDDCRRKGPSMNRPVESFTAVHPPAPALRLRWRRLEWWGASIALFLNSGALFPLVLMVQNGEIGDAERARLRLMQLPVIAITLILLSRHTGALMLAVRRSLPLVLLILLAALSVTWSIGTGVTLRRAIALGITCLLATLLAIRFTPRQLLLLVSGVIGFCLWLSLGAAVLTPSAANMPGGEGLRGIYTHKNVLGWAACLGVICGIALWQDSHRALHWRGFRLLVASVGCLLLSGSGTGIICSSVAVVLYGFYALLARTRGMTRLVCLLVVMELVAAIVLGGRPLLVLILDGLGKDATLTGRIPLWDIVDMRIAVKPWLGYGYQSFWTPGTYGNDLVTTTLQWQPPHAHNGFRDTLLSLGALGLTLLMWSLIRALRQGAALQMRAPKEGWVWLNVVIGVMIAMNLTESNLLAQNDIQWLLLSTAVIMIGLRAADRRA